MDFLFYKWGDSVSLGFLDVVSRTGRSTDFFLGIVPSLVIDF